MRLRTLPMVFGLLALVLFVRALPAQAGESSGSPAAREQFAKGEKASNAGDFAAAAQAFRKAVELDPDYAEAHESYISATTMAGSRSAAKTGGEADDATVKKNAENALNALKAQYETWAKQHPDKAVYQWALGSIYHYEANKAEQYCRKAVEIDPTFARAWYQLSLCAELKGDNGKGLEYMGKAAEAEPDNPSYAFYYSHSVAKSDPARGRQLSLQVAAKFPASERGAQALYWLAVDTADVNEKVVYLEQLRRDYPPAKFGWSMSGMTMLFEAYAKQDPAKALTFAKEMQAGAGKEWESIVSYQQSIEEAQKLIAGQKFSEAVVLLDKAKAPRYMDATALNLLKAEAISSAGDPARAYESLMVLVAAEPTPALQTALSKYAAQSNKSQKQVAADLWKLRDAKATVAKDFSLGNYFDDKKFSLADFKGKVILLNFWYPG